MVDYTRPTGNAGTMIIRDEGGQISFWLACTSSATNIGSPGAQWDGRVNGVYVSGRYTWPSGGGERRIAGPWTVSTTQDVIFYLYDSGTTGIGGPTSFTQRITRPVPPAPTNLAVARVSDTQHALTWTRNAVTTGSVVQRRTNDGSWQQIGTTQLNTVSFTDTSTQPNRKYAYRVASRNAAGQSGWSNTVTVYTVPAAPSAVSAVRSGADIVVSAASVPPYATSFDVRDGTTVVATGVSLPWTHVNPNPAVPHTYTVRGNVGSLTGAYSAASNTVQLLSPPNAPTSLAPNGAVMSVEEMVRFRWVHNPVDSSPQSAFELRYRLAGGAWTTLAGATQPFLDVDLSVGSWEWQVRTKGEHPTFSPWSATATMTVIDPPGVAVTVPGDEWDASTLPAEWSWLQAQGRPQSAWQAELVDDAGNTVESRSGSGSAATVTFHHRLAEGEWTVRVRAATGDVWSQWAEQSFTVTFDPPAIPLIEGTWDESQGGVILTIAPVNEAGFVPTSSVIVERCVDGESWELVVEVIDGTVTIDWESLSYGETLYRATASTAEGATAVADITVSARSRALWLSGGQGYGVTGRLPLNPNVQHTFARQRALKQYAGRSFPVSLTGGALSRVLAVSGNVWDVGEMADVERLTTLAQSEGDLHLFRDPDGRRIYGAVSAVLMQRLLASTTEVGWNGYWRYSFTFTEATR